MRYIKSNDVNTRIAELQDNLDANIRTIGGVGGGINDGLKLGWG